jgi:KaiC/GvpD/RAD55 family RecA-like ATPase
MRLFDRQAELNFLAGLCSPRVGKNGLAYLSRVNDDYFATAPGKEVYHLIRRHAASEGRLPRFTELRHDPRLSKAVKPLLKLKKGIDGPALIGLTRTLEHYRRGRIVYNVGRDSIEGLQGENVDVSALVERARTALAMADVSSDTKLYHFGTGSNTGTKVRRLIGQGKVVKAIPTGFQVYDRHNQGFVRESVVALTANTGGLKSAMAQQLWYNMYYGGYNTLYLSLEMPFEECVYRLFGKLTGVDQNKWMHALSTPKERREALARFDEFQAHGKKKGNRASILSVVDEDMTLDSVLGIVQAQKPDVVILDYMSLLADADSKEQWQTLSKIARRCKMLARKIKCVFILLMQMNEDESMRYSKGPSEHADYWWSWVLTDKERESGLLTIRQRKCRKGALFPFPLSVHMASGRIHDPIDELASSTGNKFDKSNKAPKVKTRPIREVKEDDDGGQYYEG